MCLLDFALVKAHYHTILRLMPPDYELTIGKLQNCFSDEEICTILCSSDATHANKVILDSLVNKIRNKHELYKLCDQLEMISASHDLNVLITSLRSGKNTLYCILWCIIAGIIRHLNVHVVY